MTVADLIEALKKLPPAALNQDVRVAEEWGSGERVVDVTFQGNHTRLETD